MKKWLLQNFLPMWAKETVLRDNRALTEKLTAAERENERLRAYIRGLHRGLHRGLRRGEKK